MLPAYIIAFRESIEASVIVATVIGLLMKLRYRHEIRHVWAAAGCAVLTVSAVIAAAALLGDRFQAVFDEDAREGIEAMLSVVSAVFITWAVLFLHRTFARGKVRFLSNLRSVPGTRAGAAVFLATFTGVVREGIEIALFLSTTYLTSHASGILIGVTAGILSGVAVSVGLFTTTLRLSVRYAFRASTVLLILFAGGMVANSIRTCIELGFLHPTQTILVPLTPSPASLSGNLVQAVFGVTRSMDTTEILSAVLYITLVAWWMKTDGLMRSTVQKADSED